MLFDFVTIDFEIANTNYNSACSLGLVAVKDNKIVETRYFLIHPPILDFDEENIRVHGITPDEVKDSPKFPEVWEQIKQYFDGNIIVAHNAIFDMSVLKCCLNEYNLEIPNFKYVNSIPITTCACRGKGIGQSLEDRAEYFGIEIEEHHNALSDAITCAQLVLKCVEIKKRKSFQSFCKVYSSIPVYRFVDLKPQTTFKKSIKRNFEKITISEITAAKDSFDESHVFYGKSIVFTGELKKLERKEAMQKVVDLGGIVKSGVSKKTDYLVVGIQDKTLVGDDGLSSKEEKAYQLIEQGFDIKIIYEDDFLKLLK